MIKISTRKAIDKYYASSALSQSTFKKLTGGLRNFKSPFKDTDSLKIGSALDSILTAEEGDFEKIFHVSNLDKLPTDSIQAIMKTIRDSLIIQHSSIDGEITDETIEKLNNVSFDIDNDELNEVILNAVTKHNYYTNRKDETRINDVKSAGKDFYFDLIGSLGKVILSSDEKVLLDKMVKNLRTNPATAKYFDRKKQKSFKKVLFHYQLPIYFTYQGLQCKALLDLCIFLYNEKDEIIKIEPIDLKSTYEDTHRFSKVARSLRYDIQAAWYTTALDIAYRSVLFPNAEIAPFKFIVESTTNPGEPVLYTASEQFLRVGKEGRKALYLTDTNFSFDGNSPDSIVVKPAIRGYEELVDEYVFYQMNGTEKERVLQENNNVLTLDID